MNRRRFLRTLGLASAAFAIHDESRLFAEVPRAQPWRLFEVTTHVEVLKPVGPTQIWLPLPIRAGTPFQRTVATNYSAIHGRVNRVKSETDALEILTVQFPRGVKPVVTVTNRVATRDWSVDLDTGRLGSLPPPGMLEHFLRPTQLLPTDGIVKQTADQIVGKAGTDAQKARAIYEWVVENTFRDPKIRGCGIGDIRFMLQTGDLGGKCADLNALFVGLARAAGIPARDAYGIRVAKSKLESSSLGAGSDNVTKAQHCRAEVYLNRCGWVPVDPADVRKVVLEEPPGDRSLSDPVVSKARQRLFGSWEMNWIAYNYAHDVTLPGSARSPLGFLMYPQAQTADSFLDPLDPDAFRYQISAQQIQPTIS